MQTVSVKLQAAQKTKRKTLHMNESSLTPFVLRELGADGIAALPPAGHMVAALLIQPSFMYDHLCLLSPHEREQYAFWLGQADLDMEGKLGYFSIRDVWALPAPQPAHLENVKSHLVVMEAGQADLIIQTALDVDDEDDEHVQTEPPDWIDSESRMCVRVPTSHAWLCTQKRWSSFALALRGRTSLRNPAWRELDAAFPAVPWPSSGQVFSPECSYEIAQSLRRTAQEIAATSDDPTAELARYHRWASMMQRTHDQLDPIGLFRLAKDFRGALDDVAPKNLGYKVSFLLQCVVMSHMLRDSGQLMYSIRSVVQLIVPPAISAVILERLSAEDPLRLDLPSPSTLTRARFALDTAYMSYCRAQMKSSFAKGGCKRYYMMDSSPQGHRDYELISVMSIETQDLDGMFQAASALVTISSHVEISDDQKAMLESRASQYISHHMSKHKYPAVVLGCGRGDLSSKFHCFMHALLLECPDMRDMPQLLSETVSITTDQGVEFSIARVRPLPVSQVFPWFSMDQDVHDDWLAVDPLLDLSKSLGVSGMLHIIHNSSKDLGRGMQSYDDTLRRMTHVCNLVRRKTTRERLLERCFGHGNAVALRGPILRFDGKIHKERWGTIAHAVDELLRVEVSLRHAWSIDRYGRGRPQRDFEGDEAAWRAEIETVDESIESAYFWDSVRVLSYLSKLITRCIWWAESCSCHWSRDWRNASPEERKLWLQCPMKGKRAPELAAGDFFDIFDELGRLYLVHVLGSLSRDLTPPQRGQLAQDFEQGRAHLFTVFTLRMSHWEEWPYLVFATAHPDRARAAGFMRQALASDCRHPYVLRLQGELHGDVDAWLNDAQLADVPALCSMLGELRFIPTAEREIEGEHSLVHWCLAF